MSAVWWSSDGNTGYLGNAPRDGLEWRRHDPFGRPGLTTISITGWVLRAAYAVVDDFGNLVQVPA